MLDLAWQYLTVRYTLTISTWQTFCCFFFLRQISVDIFHEQAESHLFRRQVVPRKGVK